jgi:hypothetical protein
VSHAEFLGDAAKVADVAGCSDSTKVVLPVWRGPSNSTDFCRSSARRIRDSMLRGMIVIRSIQVTSWN